jgi:DNA-binding response OmpR family regulator
MLSRCTADNHIRNRRRKLEVFGGDPIQSVYGVGFR